MKQPIELSRDAVVELAGQVDELTDWLNTQAESADAQQPTPLPSRLLIFSSAAVLSGTAVMFDWIGPDLACWWRMGGCTL